MPRSIPDEREHRRGLVLGLTLAEMLILLLFLLLLAMGARLKQLTTHIADLEGDSSALQARADLLEELGPDAARKLSTIRDLINKAAQIDPNDPPGVLERALSIAKKVGDRDVGTIRTLLDKLGEDRASRLGALGGALDAAARIDPTDSPAVLQRGVALLEKLGASVTPEQIRS